MRRHACVRPPLLSASTCDVLRSGGRQTRVACILGEIVYMGTEQFSILQWCVRQDKEARHGRFFTSLPSALVVCIRCVSKRTTLRRSRAWSLVARTSPLGRATAQASCRMRSRRFECRSPHTHARARAKLRYSCCRRSTASLPIHRCCASESVHAPRHRGWFSCVFRSPRRGSRTAMERCADRLKSSSAVAPRHSTAPEWP